MRRALLSLCCLLISLVLLGGCADKVEKSKKKYDEGIVLLQEGKKDEAEKKIKEAIELDPKNAKALLQIGYMNSNNPNNIEIAISYLRKGLKVDPNNELGHYTIALLYGEKGMIEYEIRELKTTIEINNDNEGAHYNLGVIMAQKRLYKYAIIEFNEVLRLNPKDTDSLSNLGVVYTRSGDLEKASEALVKLEKLDKEKAGKLSSLIDEAKKAQEEKAAKKAARAKEEGAEAPAAKQDE